MKNIKQLKDEGLMSKRLYNTLIRGDHWKYTFRNSHLRWDINKPDVTKLTPKDICELWTDKELLRWRGLGQGLLEELKSLI